MDMSRDKLANRRLDRDFFARDALAVARSLVGCFVVHEVRGVSGLHEHAAGSDKIGGSNRRVARIVETEAYRGARDLACHARAGLTKRTRSLLGEEGHAYVFLVYGMHECFNITCRREGAGHAVLVRAAEPTSGFDDGVRLDGPGRFARAMGLSRHHDGVDVTGPPIYVCPRAGRPTIAVSARIGVGYAGPFADVPWRFYDARSAHVSRPPRSAIGSGL